MPVGAPSTTHVTPRGSCPVLGPVSRRRSTGERTLGIVPCTSRAPRSIAPSLGRTLNATCAFDHMELRAVGAALRSRRWPLHRSCVDCAVTIPQSTARIGGLLAPREESDRPPSSRIHVLVGMSSVPLRSRLERRVAGAWLGRARFSSRAHWRGGPGWRVEAPIGPSARSSPLHLATRCNPRRARGRTWANPRPLGGGVVHATMAVRIEGARFVAQRHVSS